MSTSSQAFILDISELRRRAKEQIAAGPVTPNYAGDVDQAIQLLQTALATEIVCVLRYTKHAVAATGIDSASISGEFTEHANDEREHLLKIANRINQLGGAPDLDPAGLQSRAATEYGTAETLVDMLRDNLVAERIAVEHYRDLIRYFAEKDPTTRVMLEGILAQEEDHANDMHDLLVAHEGRPFLRS